MSFVEGYADNTGLEAGSADIVTCAQSFHWMDPRSVLPEVARLLRPGGVFAAYDYDVVPVIEPRVDAAFSRVIDVRWEARERLGIHAGSSQWPKSRTRRAASARAAGSRSRARCTATRRLTADGRQVIDLADSLGGPADIFQGQAPELDEAMGDLKRVALELLPGPRPMLLGYTIRIGITPADVTSP